MRNKAFGVKSLKHVGDAGLRDLELFGNINRACVSLFLDEVEDLLKWCDINRTLEVVESGEVVGFEIVEKYEVELTQMESQLVACEERVANLEAATKAYVDEKVAFHTFWELDIVGVCLSNARRLLETTEQAALEHHDDLLRESIDDLEDKAGGGVGGAKWFEGSTSCLVSDCFRDHCI